MIHMLCVPAMKMSGMRGHCDLSQEPHCVDLSHMLLHVACNEGILMVALRMGIGSIGGGGRRGRRQYNCGPNLGSRPNSGLRELTRTWH